MSLVALLVIKKLAKYNQHNYFLESEFLQFDINIIDSFVKQEDPPAYHYDPETGQYYEEQIVDANEAEQLMLAQQTQFLECEFIDPNDISLQPTVEEEVRTRFFCCRSFF